MVASNILIWNKDVGFIRIAEGTGDNLLPEDIDEGYVDYILIDGYKYDGTELVEDYYVVDGGQALLTELYQNKFSNTHEVIKYLIDEDWIPDASYTILYDE